MTNQTAVATDAANCYASALAAHYTAKDLRDAFGLYQAIIAAHPGSAEADYSRTQIHNIAKSVASKQELHASNVAVAVAHLEADASQPLPLVGPTTEVVE